MKVKAINVETLNTGTEIITTIVPESSEENQETTEETTETTETQETTEETQENQETTETTEENQETTEETQEQTAVDITDESYDNYLKEKHGIDSLQELLDKSTDEPQDKLPADVESFLKWKEENEGGSMSEYIIVTKDWGDVSDDEVIITYMKLNKPHLSSKEIDFQIDRMFSFDDETDTADDVMAKQIAKKDFLKQARDYFEKSSKDFKPSRLDEVEIPSEYKEALAELKKTEKIILSNQSQKDKQRGLFKSETDKYFSEEFKGFEFKVGKDQSTFYLPSDLTVLKESNSDLTNMLGKYVNEDGSIKDVAGYHRAISIATDPESFAKFFFDKGKTEGVEEVTNSAKNRMLKPRTVLTYEGDETKSKVRSISVDGSEYKFKLKT